MKSKMQQSQLNERCQIFNKLSVYHPGIGNCKALFYSQSYSSDFLNKIIKDKEYQKNYGCGSVLQPDQAKRYELFKHDYNRWLLQISSYSDSIYEPPIQYQFFANSQMNYGNQPNYSQYPYTNSQAYTNQSNLYQNQANNQLQYQYFQNQQYGQYQQYYSTPQYNWIDNQQYHIPQEQYSYTGNQQPQRFNQQNNRGKFQQSQYQYNQNGYRSQYNSNLKQPNNNPQEDQSFSYENKIKKNSKSYIEKQQGQQVKKPEISIANPQKQIQKISETPIIVPETPIKVPEAPKPTKYSIQQIKNFVNIFTKTNTKNVSQKLIKQISDINNWKKTQDTVEIQQNDPKNKKGSKYQKNDQNTGNKTSDSNIEKGNNYKPGQTSIFNVGGNFIKDAPVDIIIGKNQSLAGKKLKIDIAKQADAINYAEQQKMKALSLDEVQRAKLEIVYNLNLLAPENLKEIQKDLTVFIYEDQRVCKTLITEIIGKAEQQPKYASTYAKLSADFSKKSLNDFKFSVQGTIEKGSEKKSNPFKYFLIETVQHLFDSDQKHKQEDISNQIAKQNYLKNIKKKIIGNVKFIAELIICKAITKKITKYCITQLLLKFLSNHCLFNKYGKFQHSYYEYYMEAVIQFIQNIGDRFQSIDESKQKEKEKVSNYNYQAVLKIVEDLISCKSDPLKEYTEFENIPVDDFFKLFIIIDERILSIKNNRLSSLLKNLEERRDNKWQKHFVVAEGPKKLKDIKEQIQNQQRNQVTRVETRTKVALDQLQEQMGELLKHFQQNDNVWQSKFNVMSKNNKPQEIVLVYLKKMSQDNKDNVLKRLQFFSKLLDKNFSIESFRTNWPEVITSISMVSSDLPFCGAALAKILIMINNKRGIRYSDFYYKSEDEDVEYFMNQVYIKLYHYTKNQEIRKFVPDIPQKVSNLI